jgi:hypothetical protein
MLFDWVKKSLHIQDDFMNQITTLPCFDCKSTNGMIKNFTQHFITNDMIHYEKKYNGFVRYTISAHSMFKK